jgi:hypothetical protein
MTKLTISAFLHLSQFNFYLHLHYSAASEAHRKDDPDDPCFASTCFLTLQASQISPIPSPFSKLSFHLLKSESPRGPWFCEIAERAEQSRLVHLSNFRFVTGLTKWFDVLHSDNALSTPFFFGFGFLLVLVFQSAPHLEKSLAKVFFLCGELPFIHCSCYFVVVGARSVLATRFSSFSGISTTFFFFFIPHPRGCR